MPGNSYFMSLVRDLSKMKEKLYEATPPKIESVILSPTTKEKIRKNKSETDFVKLQMPWIL